MFRSRDSESLKKYRSADRVDIGGDYVRNITGNGLVRHRGASIFENRRSRGTSLWHCPFNSEPQAYPNAAARTGGTRESDMMSEMQIHTIARQMMEKHGPAAIAQAAQNAQASESKGDTEEAKEWRHVEDAMKMMRGPHQS
jgi:hypothetical protein